MKPKTDTINHPAHYNSHPSGVECITVVEHLTFNVGNAVKYLWRAGLSAHRGSEECPYIDREIQRLDSESAPAPNRPKVPT